MTENANREIAISVKDLHKFFGENHVLNGITTDILAGEKIAVIGKARYNARGNTCKYDIKILTVIC